MGITALERSQGGAHDDRGVLAVEVVRPEEVAHLHVDELEHLRVRDHVDLVDEHDELLHADLAREEQVLARLRHLAVRRGHDDDPAVHLRGARDHVLDVCRTS